MEKPSPSTDAVILTRKELERVRATCFGSELKGTGNTALVCSPEKAVERKERMRKIDLERKRKGKGAHSQIEKEEAMKQQNLLARAQEKIDEQQDAVKKMNSYVLYSKCAAIRDAQLEEKKMIKTQKMEEEKHVDLAMEMERLKALRLYEEREMKHKEERRKGAAIIREQIRERERERLRQAEMKRQEQEAMLHHITTLKDEEQEDVRNKREAGKKLMEEVAVANAEQLRLRQRQKEAEAEEDARIAEYVRQKESREAAVAEEQGRIKQEKEAEITRLRAMQEKAQDKQAELDALRAKRAQEAVERDYRRRQMEEAEKQRRIVQDLAEARELQRLDLERRLALQASRDREEFDRIVAVQNRQQEQEQMKKDKEKHRMMEYREDLRSQIQETVGSRKKDRLEFLEEGSKFRHQEQERLERLESIRQKKLSELEKMAVPPKYRWELATRPLEEDKIAK